MQARISQDNQLSIALIDFLQSVIAHLGFKSQVHFELEGCYRQNTGHRKVDLDQINSVLKQLDIAGEMIHEYWQNQWEFVSGFAGQTPLKEAHNLALLIEVLPKIFQQYQFGELQIKPVVWSGDQGKLASGSKQIFSQEQRAVHIPNAIQMNVSVSTACGKNMMIERAFGSLLQNSFLQTSYACSLLYLPEEEAFERFALKTQYGLYDELCSPNDISGGHQGSIAYYLDKGKHNQAMGVQPLLYSVDQKVLLSEQDWHSTARVEHRLGAASEHYNPYYNVLFALLNVVNAIEHHLNNQNISEPAEQVLPISLQDQYIDGQNCLGAITLFEQDQWFSEKVDQIIRDYRNQITCSNSLPQDAGRQMKRQILAHHQPQIISRLNS